jgi:4-amino-4-deoxy-L-arabinose transferase-like glycosyltransferase
VRSNYDGGGEVKRRLFKILLAVSLLLCVATVVLWMRTKPGAYEGEPPAGWTHLYEWGFRWKIVGVWENIGPIYATNAPTGLYAFIVAITALPGIWLLVQSAIVAVYSRARRRLGRCSHCGYDLRATPERCPECGAVPAGAAK